MLVKLLFKFGFKEHMEALLQEGQLYMGTFKSYRENENSEIGDKNEGAHRITTSTNVTFDDVHKDTGKLSFLGELKDVTVREFSDTFEQSRIYCMYRVEIELNDLTQLSSILDVELLERFGYDSFVMVANVSEFYSRIDSFMENEELIYKRDLVVYKDLSNGDQYLSPYIKDIRFLPQSEYRICIQKVLSEEPLAINIGNLEDISAMYAIKDINKIHINLKAASNK